jgi:hypothetical protein
MIDESRDAPQLEAALLFEYEMMRIETYSRQPDLMFHAIVPITRCKKSALSSQRPFSRRGASALESQSQE